MKAQLGWKETTVESGRIRSKGLTWKEYTVLKEYISLSFVGTGVFFSYRQKYI